MLWWFVPPCRGYMIICMLYVILGLFFMTVLGKKNEASFNVFFGLPFSRFEPYFIFFFVIQNFSRFLLRLKFRPSAKIKRQKNVTTKHELRAFNDFPSYIKQIFLMRSLSSQSSPVPSLLSILISFSSHSPLTTHYVMLQAVLKTSANKWILN